MTRPFKKVGQELIYKGPIASVREDKYQYPDGTIRPRQVIVHPGAVCIAAHDGRVLYMVRQPREAVEEEALLELPAGKLDVEGETPLQAAQRELAEEIGKSAGDWRDLRTFYASPGITTERFHLFLATELYDVDANPDDDEQIEVVEFPLDQIDEAIGQCRDGKSLVGLLMLKDLLEQ
jgi:ADP-ribose pyrophosphatase